MKTKKHFIPILCVLSLGLFALNPLVNNKKMVLDIKFYSALENSPSDEDDPRKGGLLRYKFFVKEKETLPGSAVVDRQNQLLAKYENKEKRP